MSIITVLNVSGRIFEVEKDVLSKFPESTLGKVAASGQTAVTYQRPAAMFKCVLAYHQTGHLHVPLSVCPGSIQDELAFWGYTLDHLDPCCRRKLMKFQREQEDFKKFEKSFLEKIPKDGTCCHLPESYFTKGRRCLWAILDRPFSSLPAKIYYLISSLVILLSILTLFLGTLDSFQEALTIEQWKEYYGNYYHEFKDKIDILHGRGDVLQQSKQTRDEIVGNYTLPADVHVRNEILEYVQTSCALFFAAELVLKLLCCPSVIVFLKSFFNIIDIMAVLVSITNVISEIISRKEKYMATNIDVVAGLHVFRVMRLLRLTKNIPGARVLAFSAYSSYKELCFMVLLIGINTILFGALAFSVDKDTMKSLPSASWWALITMTTVGYGDIVPTNHAGKFIGALCACMGIIVLALTMPLFVDNFLTFYGYCHDVCHENAVKMSKKTSPGMRRDVRK